MRSVGVTNYEAEASGCSKISVSVKGSPWCRHIKSTALAVSRSPAHLLFNLLFFYEGQPIIVDCRYIWWKSLKMDARQETKRKTSEKIHGCREEGVTGSVFRPSHQPSYLWGQRFHPLELSYIWVSPSPITRALQITFVNYSLTKPWRSFCYACVKRPWVPWKVLY